MGLYNFNDQKDQKLILFYRYDCNYQEYNTNSSYGGKVEDAWNNPSSILKCDLQLSANEWFSSDTCNYNSWILLSINLHTSA